MSALVDPVTDADLDAYVDDQLDVTRRIEVGVGHRVDKSAHGSPPTILR